jgi:hypothetical protein
MPGGVKQFTIFCAAAVLIFRIAGLLYLLRFERVDNLGAYRIPSETGFLIPSGYDTCRLLYCGEVRGQSQRYFLSALV